MYCNNSKAFDKIRHETVKIEKGSQYLLLNTKEYFF